MEADRNFDDLAARFQKKVYGTPKGSIRLAVLEKDLREFFPLAMAPAGSFPLRVLDAGGGTGPFSAALARRGHRITLCDLSENMLALARERFANEGTGDLLTLCHCGIQQMDPGKGPGFDLVLCHAVLGWVADPEQVLSCLAALVRPGGMLSLTFYNLNGMIFKNLLRTNYKKILKKAYAGYPGSLTPAWPRRPEQVLEWLSSLPFDLLCHSGIRVFHDYILSPQDREKAPATVLDLECEFSRIPPYRDLGRYQHLLCRRT
jgi:S-adenosylmethionine-dependent methyltransferase